MISLRAPGHCDAPSCTTQLWWPGRSCRCCTRSAPRRRCCPKPSCGATSACSGPAVFGAGVTWGIRFFARRVPLWANHSRIWSCASWTRTYCRFIVSICFNHNLNRLRVCFEGWHKDGFNLPRSRTRFWLRSRDGGKHVLGQLAPPGRMVEPKGTRGGSFRREWWEPWNGGFNHKKGGMIIIKNWDLTWIWVCLSMEYIPEMAVWIEKMMMNQSIWECLIFRPTGTYGIPTNPYRKWVVKFWPTKTTDVGSDFVQQTIPFGGCRFLTCDETVREDAFPG